MRGLANAAVAIVVMTILLAVAKLTGWSPANLVFGPQYVAPRAQEPDSRARFLEHTVPALYPKLIASLRSRGPETVRWISRTGEPQEQLMSLANGTLTIETSIFAGSSPEDAATTRTKVLVVMRDFDLDGRMDQITYSDKSGQTHTRTAPFDEGSQYLWDSGLALAFRYGSCCRQ